MNSMTGIGRAKGKIGDAHVMIEIKSVNHKFCEVNARLPSRYQSFEQDLVGLIKKNISRGKIDLWLGEDREETELVYSEKALKKYHSLLCSVKQKLKLADVVGISHLQAGSNFWMFKSDDLTPHAKLLCKLVQKAVDDLVQARKKEGHFLTKQISLRLKTLEKLHHQVGMKKNDIVAFNHDKIQKRVEALLKDVLIDQARLANEIAYMTDKTDVTEELERLMAHFAKMKEYLAQDKSVGRSIDFLIQEMNREWNTVGSKVNDATIAHWVVEAKSELEKIREQVQNIE